MVRASLRETKRSPRRTRRGFTLIELMVALTIVALLLSIVTPRYWNTVSRAEDVTLRENLRLVRDAIDKYYGDLGRYPETLQALVDERYLRFVPEDPVTRSTETWVLVPPRETGSGAVFDVRSGAEGAGRDGRAYASY